MSRIVALCKRRGFIFPASEIYGGLNGFWDFGPLGVQLKNNLRDAWWRDMVLCPPIGPDGKPLSIVGLDSSIIQHPQTWVSSGHVGGFNDLMTDCRETKLRYRADHVMVFNVLYEDKKGTIETLLIGSIDGDDVLHGVLKKAKKVLQKNGGGTICTDNENDVAEIYYKAFNVRPFSSLSDEDQKSVYGPDASEPGTLTEPRPFNLMFESYVGVFQNEDSKVYLRPETAQGIFLNYKSVLDSTRVRPPFGIAQVGKAFRNEVTPRNFIFRTREFEQMEMEFFCPPEESATWFEFWVCTRLGWWKEQGLSPGNLLRRDHEKDELSHYSTATADVEYLYPFTAPDFGELEGIAHRGDFDLTQHQAHSKTKLEYFDQENSKSYLPHVIEPASGLTRGVLALLCEAYQYDESRASPEWLKLKPALAPVKAGIFPLVNKDGMPEVAEKLYLDLRKAFPCQYDAKQSIGKRYARMDEAGTPFCITVDGDTLKDQNVTIRIRDTAQQEKVQIDKVKTYIQQKIS
ncbi:MAG: glycine--tRNA ligase [Alphaproteobacteria bacterium]|nr:glycine--tRNA ligase [Alphaproteobacteria bacterium]